MIRSIPSRPPTASYSVIPPICSVLAIVHWRANPVSPDARYTARMVSESASPPAVPRAHAAIIDGVLGLLGRVRTGDPEPVADSLLNDNYRVPTDTGDLFIRIHQKGRSRERVLREQRVAMWAGERGVPVLKPLADARGATTWNVRNRWVSVY